MSLPGGDTEPAARAMLDLELQVEAERGGISRWMEFQVTGRRGSPRKLVCTEERRWSPGPHGCVQGNRAPFGCFAGLSGSTCLERTQLILQAGYLD